MKLKSTTWSFRLSITLDTRDRDDSTRSPSDGERSKLACFCIEQCDDVQTLARLLRVEFEIVPHSLYSSGPHWLLETIRSEILYHFFCSTWLSYIIRACKDTVDERWLVAAAVHHPFPSSCHHVVAMPYTLPLALHRLSLPKDTHLSPCFHFDNFDFLCSLPLTTTTTSSRHTPHDTPLSVASVVAPLHATHFQGSFSIAIEQVFVMQHPPVE